MAAPLSSSSLQSPQMAPEPAGGLPASDALHFEGFSILPAERRLLVAGETVKIGARAFDLLLVLVAARDRVVGKGELLERVWPGLVVEENNLSVHVSQLRKLCGLHAIATVPGRGYQFTGASMDAVATRARAPHAEGGEDAPPGERQATPRGNLPLELPPLIGREAELQELRQMLQVQRWITITGAGGMGKTRLAEQIGLEAAAHMPAWMVELAAVSDARFVPSAVAQVLGTTIIDTDRPLDGIVASLQGQPVLLILDNCEHLIAAVSALCRQLLRELPLLRVLITSQELLRGADEVVYKLGPLTLPDPLNLGGALQAGSVQLLKARVQALSRHFEIDSRNVADAAIICQQLDGLPLAIELAAGRVPMLGLDGVRARLGELFRLLTGDARVRLRRHQTLRAALDWSYQLLAPAEQALLRRVGVFAGSFSIEGVRQIARDLGADEWDVLDTLGSLIDKSLVQVRGLSSPRYQMLETARAYALEQLASNEETSDALARHARATQQVCSLATRRRDTQAIWDEIPNIRAAFSWAMRNGDTELAVGLVNDSSVVLALGGLVGEVVQRLVEVEPCINEQLPRPLAAQYWQWLGRFGNDGRLPAYRCVAALQAAEGLFRELANDRHVHACLRMRAEALVEQGDLDAASQAIDCAHQLERPGSPLADRMRRLRIEAKILEARTEYGAAMDRLQQALDMARLADIHRYVATLTQDIGQCLLHAGDPAAAEQRFRAVLDDARPDLSVALAAAYARMGLATALLAQGRLGPAQAAALEAIPRLRSCGILLAHSEVFAWLLAALGQFQHATVLLGTADSFRAFSQTTRGPLQARALQAARELLGPAARDPEQAAAEAIGSDAELAQMLASALAIQPDMAPAGDGQASA
jgi:predicted ATPase/DNA-binding winged helix-turn-helix (wHTH) protein